MTESEYLEDRVENQIRWYSCKSRDIKKKFFKTQVAEIIISTIISGGAQFTLDNKFMGNIITILGIMLVISSAIRNLFKWQDLWIKYRSTSEMLKREKFLFLTKSGIYKNEKESFNTFVERIEGILSSENESWIELNTATT